MDPVSAARTARESLARGLAALQSPGVPPQLLAVADPVAQAMSALHRIESSGGAALAEAAPGALGFVRQALATLQSQQIAHPAIEQAMEAIAGSLGMVHQLTQVFSPPTQPAAQKYAAPPQTAAHPPRPAPYNNQPAPAQPYAQPQQYGYGQSPQHAQPAQVSPYAGTLLETPAFVPAPQGGPPHTQPSHQVPYAGRPEAKPQVAVANPGSAAQSGGNAAPAPPQNWENPARGAHVSTLASASEAGFQRIEAALGAHSTTNFYKGLSGNDVIESGGIFVATYQIPTIGSNVLIHVSLPGGYEFEAVGVVRWTREAPASGSDSPPGFGAQFTQISAEGRQLVYRYVRNREPLFHDDF